MHNQHCPNDYSLRIEFDVCATDYLTHLKPNNKKRTAKDTVNTMLSTYKSYCKKCNKHKVLCFYVVKEDLLGPQSLLHKLPVSISLKRLMRHSVNITDHTIKT